MNKLESRVARGDPKTSFSKLLSGSGLRGEDVCLVVNLARWCTRVSGLLAVARSTKSGIPSGPGIIDKSEPKNPHVACQISKRSYSDRFGDRPRRDAARIFWASEVGREIELVSRGERRKSGKEREIERELF